MSTANKERIQSTCHIAAYGLLLLEVLVNIVVIHRVKYTEIDWIAYMQARQENLFQNKNRNYKFVHSIAQQKRIFSCEAEFGLFQFLQLRYAFVPMHTC